MIEETENPETEKAETVNTETSENEINLEDEFAEFINTSSEHSFENNEAEKTNTAAIAPENNLTFADEFKVTMFIGFIFMFLDGIHAFVYQFFSKYKFDKKELAMDADDKEALELYFKTPRVAALLNKIPTELIGVAHMEYIYFQKFQEILERKKEEDEYNEEIEKDAGKSMTPEQMEAFMEKFMRKQNAKKKPAKKKVVKKAAKKTATKKDEQRKS